MASSRIRGDWFNWAGYPQGPGGASPQPTIRGTAFGTGIIGVGGLAVSISPPQAGDIILVQLAINYTFPVVTFPSGWVKLVGGDFNYSDAGGVMAYKVATGAEGSSINLTAPSSLPVAWVSRTIKDVVGVPEAILNAMVVSTASDPAALTPSWGATKDSLWLVALFQSVSYNVTVPPTGYGNPQAAQYGGNNVAVWSGYKTGKLASDNPAALTIASPGSWNRAITLAVKGA